MTIRRRALALIAAATAGVLALTACSATGGKQKETMTSAAGGGAVADTPRYTVAMVTHEAPGDSFWDKVRKGAETAAAKDNIELRYSADPTAAGQATLVQNAVDSKVDGLAVTLVQPAAMKAPVGAAVGAGIPVVAFNAGIDQYKDVGAMMYFGSDENVAGNAVGERIAAAGARHPLCVIQEQGSVSLEARCKGVLAKAPGTENLQVDGKDIPTVTATIAAKLQQDPSIDYVVTLGAPIAQAALQSVQQSASAAQVVTFDLNAEVAARIKDGSILFAIDQQPFLQGYLAVDSLWLYLTNRNDIGGGLPVLTGPSFVDRTNIDAIAEFAANNTR
ncbi:substrate-binding domain-containing protein [Nakamurella sp.]|uniref:substrate-binding domain-containing protein n=1 Tax=Nakamurella sp. TaxID=1869182 RepID=UPI003B3A7DEA